MSLFLVPQQLPSEDDSDADTVILADLEMDLGEVEEQVANGVVNVDKIFGVLIEHQLLKLVQTP
jgi:hypothetical protein